jgi:NAD(P)H-dependent FMN reductase
MGKLFIPVILGTAREGRKSEAPARFVYSELQKKEEVETDFVDVRDFVHSATTPPWGVGGIDEKPTKWKEIATRADGFIFVVPEYNHGYPGEFKMLLDSLFWNEYSGKPVAVCGTSKGMFGARALVDHIKPVLIELKMVPIRSAMYFSKIEETFAQVDEGDKEEHKEESDEAGGKTEALKEPLSKMFDELVQYASTLREMRHKK